MHPLISLQDKPLKWTHALLLAVVAVVSFNLAYRFAWCHLFIVLFLYCIFRLAALGSARQAFYYGFAVGLAAYTPQLLFFQTLFHAGAYALWCVLPLWLALFLITGRACLFRFGPVAWAFAAPFVWMGLEFFRSEMYFLRFTWLNAGYVFSNGFTLHFMAGFGVYGVGFLLMAWAAFAGVAPVLAIPARVIGPIVLAVISTYPFWLPSLVPSSDFIGQEIHIAGVQLEGPSVPQTHAALDAALKKYPNADLFVLSEYTFDGPVPPEIRHWCKQHAKWLAAGGEVDNLAGDYYNTVFVVGPDGATTFQQAKCVPVQFMKDGLPAEEQHVWKSPWGKIGFGICYDASYTRVTDELIRQGAQLLIFPTMDNADWGASEHELHARIAPMRAAEYNVPVFRLCSSGISQALWPTGRLAASAPFPGPGEMLDAKYELPRRGRLPPDRWLARYAVAATGFLWLLLIADAARKRRQE